ncbi:hypothetical protein HYT55_00895 [Candidatus Woesearchaeota archaeon]|nr:hypothetical protein [Candidatus Woesearchaeota archaeon]
MISPKYVNTITDEKLEEKLFQRENVSALEDLLNSTRKEYQVLREAQRRRKRVSSRKVTRQDELESVFNEVKECVDEYLGFHFKDRPICSFSKLRDYPDPVARKTTRSFYATGTSGLLVSGIDFTINPLVFSASIVVLGIAAYNHLAIRRSRRYYCDLDKIIVRKDEYQTMLPVLAHEYAHAVQRRFPPLRSLWNFCQNFIEGHARGVQRHVAKSYWEREDNPGFMDFTVREDTRELHLAYRLLCDRFSQQPHKTLVKGLPKETLGQRLYRRTKGKVDPHILGNAIMLLHEAQHGAGIYRDMLHGHYAF